MIKTYDLLIIYSLLNQFSLFNCFVKLRQESISPEQKNKNWNLFQTQIQLEFHHLKNLVVKSFYIFYLIESILFHIPLNSYPYFLLIRF